MKKTPRSSEISAHYAVPHARRWTSSRLQLSSVEKTSGSIKSKQYQQFKKYLHHVSSVTYPQTSNSSTNICTTCLASRTRRLSTVQQTSAPRVKCHLPADFQQFNKHLHHVSSVTYPQTFNSSTNICTTCQVSRTCRLSTVQQTSAPRVKCYLPADFQQFNKHLHHVSSVTYPQTSNSSTNICTTCQVSPTCRVLTVQQTSAPRVKCHLPAEF